MSVTSAVRPNSFPVASVFTSASSLTCTVSTWKSRWYDAPAVTLAGKVTLSSTRTLAPAGSTFL